MSAEAAPSTALLEAILVAVDEPVPSAALAAHFGVAAESVDAALHALAASYEEQNRGFRLRCSGSGWRLYAAREFAGQVRELLSDGSPSRLSPAALETLAVIAYRQPVTRGRIAAIRGVSADAAVRGLQSRGLIEQQGKDEDTGAALYVTTPLLLDQLGLRSLDQLPSLGPLLPLDVETEALADDRTEDRTEDGTDV